MFVSRADKVIVHELAAAPGQTIDATLRVNTALPGVPRSAVRFATLATISDGSGYLDLRGDVPVRQARSATRASPGSSPSAAR